MAATTTRFGFDLRVLLCEWCGAPIDAAPEGGSVTCRYCGAVLQVAARVALPEFASVAAASIAEPERLARLAAQAREAVVAPAGLAAVLANDEIPPWRAGEAFAVWQSVRRRAAEGDLVASEELSYLTSKLWIRLDAEPERQRALLETTLETLALPRHRQLVLGALVQGAVHVGDRDAAERWLSRCDASLEPVSRWSRPACESRRATCCPTRPARTRRRRAPVPVRRGTCPTRPRRRTGGTRARRGSRLRSGDGGDLARARRPRPRWRRRGGHGTARRLLPRHDDAFDVRRPLAELRDRSDGRAELPRERALRASRMPYARRDGDERDARTEAGDSGDHREDGHHLQMVRATGACRKRAGMARTTAVRSPASRGASRRVTR